MNLIASWHTKYIVAMRQKSVAKDGGNVRKWGD